MTSRCIEDTEASLCRLTLANRLLPFARWETDLSVASSLTIDPFFPLVKKKKKKKKKKRKEKGRGKKVQTKRIHLKSYRSIR